MSKKYNQGIVSPKGFDMAAAEPVDQREVVEFYTDLATLVNCYPGLEVKVEEQGYDKYKLLTIPSSNLANWIVVESGIGPEGPAGPQGDPGSDGPTGPTGATGIQGEPGIGVPTLGTTGQVLSKIDNTSYNTEWADVLLTETDPIWTAEEANVPRLDATNSFSASLDVFNGNFQSNLTPFAVEVLENNQGMFVSKDNIIYTDDALLTPKTILNFATPGQSNTQTFQDATGTVALTIDITGTNSGTNTGDNSVNTLYSGLVTNATHSGDVAGATVLTIQTDAVDIDMLSATGTASGTTFLRGDNVWAAPAGSGDMLLADAQTNSGVKTFNDTTFLLRNVANTFNGSFVNTNTADRIYTLQDVAGTLAFTSDITGANSGTNTGDQTTIVGITGTKSEFDIAVTDGDFMYIGDTPTSHTHLLAAGATDVTATTAEVNLLDLAGMTAGWVLSADTATTASWKAPFHDNIVTSKSASYTTALSENGHTIYMTAGTVVTLDSTSLSIGYDQAVFNSTGGDITFSSSDTIEGSNVALADREYAAYTLVAATTWALTVPEAAVPVTDTTAIVKGSGDATKLVRIEADGLTTATTRVITMPDANVDLVNTPSATEKTVLGNTTNTNSGDEPAASTTVAGIVELATNTEVDTGTSTTLAITPDALEGSALQASVNELDVVTIRTISTTTDTLVIADKNKYIRCTNATSCVVTVPPNSSVAFLTGTQIHFRAAAAGQVTMTQGAGVTINTAETLLLRKIGSSATIIKVGTDEWDLTGDLELV